MTLELIAVLVTLAAVYLTARQVIWCWPLALVSVSLYAVIFYQARLFAETGLQGLYFGLSVYGWWAWLKGGEGHSELTVSRASARLAGGLLALGLVAGAALGATLDSYTAADLPFLDSTLAAFSVIAQWMQTRKLLEAWLLWIAVDVVYVGMFAFKELYPTAGLYLVFLLLAGLGFREWQRSLAADPAAGELA